MTKKNNEIKGLLKKKISELTENDLDRLEVPLGTESRPYPMFGTVVVNEDGEQSIEQRLGSIKSDTHPMVIYSERPYDEVIGMMYRDMPTPSMLSMQKDILEMVKPESKNRIYFMKGDPGSGKSFLGGLTGRVQSERPADIFDCGGKNMNDVLFEMVLDFGTSDALPVAIDKRIQAHALQELSYAMLKNEVPAQYIEETKDKRLVIDWDSLKTAGTDDVEKTFDTLKKVSHIEGLDSAGGNALGMNSQYGRAITDFMEGNFSTWDEYNKSKEGTDNALQTFLQFANGEINECTVPNPLKNKDETSGPSEFTFRREDVKLGWGIILTGNAVEDGSTTRSLNKSVYSRLTPVTIPKPTKMDWQHRISQMMTGLPISTLHNTFRKTADADPDKFGEMLLHWRKVGLTEDQKNNIPEMQISMLKNWKNTLDASEKLAEFYQGWAELTDPEIALTKDGNLVEEVDEEYQKEVSIDFRKIIQHINSAMPIRPKMSKEVAPASVDMDVDSWATKPAKRIKKADENLERNFGTRLTDLLADKIYQTSGAAGKPHLYDHLKALMKECGLKDLHLQEGAHSEMQSVESSLNISLFDTTDFSEQVKLAQEMFCDYLRKEDPDITTGNDSIITIAQMKDVMEKMENSKDNLFVIPNTNHETLHAEPFVKAEIWDMANEEMSKREFIIDNLVEHDAFMMTLAFPKAGEKNLKAIWDEANNLTLLTMKVSSSLKQEELEIEIADIKALTPDSEKQIEKQSEDLIDKQKELLGFIQIKVEQLKSLGRVTDKEENEISNLKQELTDKNVALEDDTSTTLPPTVYGLMPEDDVKIAENNSDTGIGATSVVVKAVNDNGKSVSVPIHIIVNNKSKKTLIVSDNTPESLSSMFREVGILHVNRKSNNVKTVLREALNEILRGASDDTRDDVKSALIFRNEPKNVENHEISTHNNKASIEDILLSYKPYVAKYVLAKK